MELAQPLIEGLFIRRYKRFFADVELPSGEVITAHVPNTGSLKGCLQEGASCRITKSQDPKRKLKYSLQFIKTPTSWVGVNTSFSNDLVWELFHSNPLPHWKAFTAAQREVKLNDKSRIDVVFWKSEDGTPTKIKASDFSKQKFHFVEVKNVTLAQGHQAQFPDAVTTRGQKHIEELMSLMNQGHSAELVFTIQRQDCCEFAAAKKIDSKYADLLKEAADMGLVISPLSTKVIDGRVSLLTTPLEVIWPSL